ncbi:ribonuclease HII-domain-containing protein [Tuber borchii]|uniref:Ribonuclease n=1 Tax=Tuber borchii TaxID=42251 RepID=A0A2T6ZLX4_TUBBO|nr:ribonuclease HII-domain-containing protein [Tuber borchii]
MAEEDSQPLPEELSDAGIEVAGETAKEAAKILPSIDNAKILKGETYTYHSPIPKSIQEDPKGEVILGVDEAGRGPVLGPMVYAVAYCLKSDNPMLREHKFDDSKKLTHTLRTNLLQTLTTPDTTLHRNLGWSTISLSPRDISSGMLRSSSSSTYNLNAQAFDATAALITAVLAGGVNVREIYVDTVGTASTYQSKLLKLFPNIAITVSKKADSIYPIVSAASVCAKVTRDAAIEVLVPEGEEIGSGYPGDEKTKGWLKRGMDPVFGWEVGMARFSWATAKDMLEGGGKSGGVGGGVEVVWPGEDGAEQTITGLWGGAAGGGWYGRSVHGEF